MNTSELEEAVKELYLALQDYVLMVAQTAVPSEYEDATKHPLLDKYSSFMTTFLNK